MSNGEFIELLIKDAKRYQPSSAESLRRNQHMHKLRDELPQEAIDAVLTDFLNFVGSRRCMDLGFYADDFAVAKEQVV